MASKPPQLLKLTPATEIVFEGPFDKVVTSYLELMNPREEVICFKVKTTAPRRYCVRPNSGTVSPGSKVKIAIMLQPLDEDESERSKHKFMVQSLVMSPESEKLSLEQIWKQATNQNNTMDSKLRCVFHTPGQDNDQDDAASLSRRQPQTMPVTSITTSYTPNNANAEQTMSQAAGDGQKSAKNDDDQVSKFGKSISSSSTAEEAATQAGLPPYSPARTASSKNFKATTPKSDQSMASNTNLTASFLQPMSDDHRILLVGLVTLIIGVILGKYII